MARFDCSNSGPYLSRAALRGRPVVRPKVKVPEISEEDRSLVRGWIKSLPDEVMEAEYLEEAGLPYDDFAAFYAQETGTSLNALAIRQIVEKGRRVTHEEALEAMKRCILQPEE